MPNHKKRVLIIDDEEDLLEALILRFESTGRFKVETAFNAEGGLEKMRSFRPDAVLLDIAMPKMDGWEFCRRLKADPATAGVPVVVMTAALTSNLKEQAQAAGVVRLLVKPFDEKELLAAVREASSFKTNK